jgi:hypothetical protein
MTARHYLAVAALDSRETDVDKILAFLTIAASDCALYNKAPERDPAFVLLASHLAFLTNADISSPTKYERYYRLCKEEVDKDAAIIQSSETFN